MREQPKWLQAGIYPARLDRHVIEELFRRNSRVMRGFLVSQKSTGADFSVEISAGSGVAMGTTQIDQGAYVLRSDAPESLAVPASPASAQVDAVYAVVNDPNAGGPNGDNFVFAYVAQGAAVPGDSIHLANIARTPGESAIFNAAITDMRPLGEWSWTVSTGPPVGRGVPGDLWVVCP